VIILVLTNKSNFFYLGIPADVVDLIKIWLEDRSYYVSIDGKNSMFVEFLCSMVKGSILGPIVYATYVSPLFDLHNLTNFADDNLIIKAQQPYAGACCWP
jgi:hypothetical protein